MAGILSLERTGDGATQQIQHFAMLLGELSSVARGAPIGGQRPLCHTTTWLRHTLS